MEHLPPEYAGSKVTSTRTFRDIVQTNEDFNNLIKKAVEDAKKKDEEKNKDKKPTQDILFKIVLLLVLSPIITYIEYTIYLKIFYK